MTGILLRKIKTVSRIEFLRSARIGVDRLLLTALGRIHEFDPWHAAVPTSGRGYRHTVAQVVNDLKPVTLVEVGYRPGYIQALINVPRRHGYDVDEGAVRPARFLHRVKVTFIHGDMTVVSLPQIDVLILVNWIHDIGPQVLEAIGPEGPTGYRYKHDFSYLDGKARRVSITRPPDEGRSFQLFEVVA